MENDNQQISDTIINEKNNNKTKIDTKRLIHINCMIDCKIKMDKYLNYLNNIINNPHIYNENKQNHWEKDKEHWKNRQKYYKSEKFKTYCEKYIDLENDNNKICIREKKEMDEEKIKEEEIIKKEEQLIIIKNNQQSKGEQLKNNQQSKGEQIKNNQQKKEEQLKNIQQKEEQNDILNCLICCERQKCILLKPCNHCYLCLECSKDVKECGLCRSQVIGYEKIFI
jgi:hypothetical protein